MSRFSADLQARFDIVSFGPRGIGRSNPVKCSAAVLAQQPSPVITSQSSTKTLSYNRELSKDCRANTGPLYDHVDTLQMVYDLDAIRVALGETKLTFHGSSYGTLLGEQYAEVYPQRVRAVVLESVVDHKRFQKTQQPQVALTPFTLSYAAFRTFYEPGWPKLAGVLMQLDESKPPVVVPPPTPTGRPRMQTAIDNYLISQVVPKRGTSCPAGNP